MGKQSFPNIAAPTKENKSLPQYGKRHEVKKKTKENYAIWEGKKEEKSHQKGLSRFFQHCKKKRFNESRASKAV